MNNKFDFKRFRQVVAEDWKLYFRRFGITLTVWACLPIILWITSLVFEIDVDPSTRAGFILAFIIATVMTVPAHMYGKVNLSRDGVSFAMLPATSTEKFLSMVLFCSIITPLFCGLGAWAVDSFLTLLPFGGFKKYVTIPETELLGYGFLHGIIALHAGQHDLQEAQDWKDLRLATINPLCADADYSNPVYFGRFGIYL